MKINLKKYIPILFISFSIMILFGTSYALLRDSSKGENPYVMKVGLLEISFIDSETNTLSLTNAVPVSDEEGMESEELVFTIKNTGTLPANYNVYIEETSTDMEFKSVIRYVSNKNDLGYGEIKTLSLDNYIDYESKLDVGETITYKVKLWLAETADSTYMNKTFSARIVVDVALNDSVPTLLDGVENAVGYGGLVAITTDGDLYTGEGEIREYRYSGLDVNNYIYFNCKDNDGTYDYGNENYNYASNCETWRIVGVFEEDSEQVIKIMRNTVLTDIEVPATYTVNGTSFTLDSGGNGYSYWNSTKTGTNYNDWTMSGLQYFLNTESDSNSIAGYLSTLTASAEELIRTTTYNLGNVVYNTTTKEMYTAERNTSSIHSGNYGTWSGKVALLYPSDYGYSVNNAYWDVTTGSNGYNTEQSDGVILRDTSWMQVNTNHDYYEWLLSPSSAGSSYAMRWLTTGLMGYYVVNAGSNGIRPCLYLESSAKTLKGTGESSNPYVVTR